MAHGDKHVKASGWIPESEYVALEALAKARDRSISYELRQAIRNWLALHAAEVPTLYEPAKKGSA